MKWTGCFGCVFACAAFALILIAILIEDKSLIWSIYVSIFGGFGLFMLAAEIRIQFVGVRTTGRVVGFEDTDGGWYTQIIFQDRDGLTHVATDKMSSCIKWNIVGYQVRIIYDPRNPQNVRIATPFRLGCRWIMSLICIAVGYFVFKVVFLNRN